MKKCWEAAPDDRPSFKELHMSTSKYIECIAGYLEIGFNPFAGIKKDITTKENNLKDKENEIESSLLIQVIPPSMDTSVAHSALTNGID